MLSASVGCPVTWLAQCVCTDVLHSSGHYGAAPPLHSVLLLADEPRSEDESKKRKRLAGKRKKESRAEEGACPLSCDLDQDLDRALEDRAIQHNLTVVNVRNILHVGDLGPLAYGMGGGGSIGEVGAVVGGCGQYWGCVVSIGGRGQYWEGV